MSAGGVAILMSTHTLEVAQEMCDRISIILKGRIIARGTVDELRAMAGDTTTASGGAAGGEEAQLTAVFLRLTGGGALQEIDEIV
jgi:ABC-2 type transport system ATP-binding protein